MIQRNAFNATKGQVTGLNQSDERFAEQYSPELLWINISLNSKLSLFLLITLEKWHHWKKWYGNLLIFPRTFLVQDNKLHYQSHDGKFSHGT